MSRPVAGAGRPSRPPRSSRDAGTRDRRSGGTAPAGGKPRRGTDPARTAAWETLRAVDERDAYANLVLPALLRRARLRGRDAGLATELAYGTLRGRGLYDAVLAACTDRPLSDIDAGVLDALRLGVHQLISMRIPQHAAVSTTVDLVRGTSGPGASRFANAVLRRVTEQAAETWPEAVAPDADRDPDGHLAILYSHPAWMVRALRDALRTAGRPVDELPALLAAHNERPRVALAALPGLSTVEELAAAAPRHARAGEGAPDGDAAAAGEAHSGSAVGTAPRGGDAVGEEARNGNGTAEDAHDRVAGRGDARNGDATAEDAHDRDAAGEDARRDGTAEDARDRVAAGGDAQGGGGVGVRGEKARGDGSGGLSPVGVVVGGAPDDVAAVREGRARVQDEGSQVVTLALAAAEVLGDDGGQWLDLCAGPGGKAALLGALLAERHASGALTDDAELVAVEVAEHRAQLVSQALAPVPAAYDLRVADGRTAAADEAGRYDRVLVDAPCTGMGALRRRPEARWRRTPADLATLGPLQRDLLAAALDAVRPGGVVAYATCSPHPAETRAVVDDVLKRRSDVTRLDTAAVLRGLVTAPEKPYGPGPDVQLWTHLHGTDSMYVALLRKDGDVPR